MVKGRLGREYKAPRWGNRAANLRPHHIVGTYAKSDRYRVAAICNVLGSKSPRQL
jgi:hypothetical protein